MSKDDGGAARAREAIERICEQMAVQAVSEVTSRLSKDGKLYAYDGIEAARAIRDQFTDAIMQIITPLPKRRKKK